MVIHYINFSKTCLFLIIGLEEKYCHNGKQRNGLLLRGEINFIFNAE